MKTEEQALALRRVGASGQISLGKERAGQTYQEEERADGTIVLTPVVVLPAAHWTVRDKDTIKEALEWAAATPARATDLEALITRAQKGTKRAR